MKWVRRLEALAIATGLVVILLVVVMVVSVLANPTGVAIVLAVALGLAVAARWARRRVPVGTVLELDLDQGVIEEAPPGSLGRYINRGSMVIRDITDALRRGAEDDRVVGVIARLGNGGISLGHAQELRDAVHRFRSAGKRTVAFAESFGEGSLATVDYYLATAFEEIHLQPGGEVGVGGVLERVPFLRGLLDLAGIVPDFDHRMEYKAAKYLLTEESFTPPHEEAARSVLEDQFGQIVSGVAADRGIPAVQVRKLIDRAPLLSSEALEAGLVDRLSYRDQAYCSVLGDGRPMFIENYLRRAGRPHRRGTRVALIYGTGSIHRGRSVFDPMTRGLSFGVDDVASAFREAIDDRKVKAIVFRVDSPGGSAVASEVMRRETVRAREAGKAVVVSMGNVAGSGGYWISTSADRIVAQPGTVTGSIGVVGGKLAVRAAWRRLGVNMEELHLGRNATFTLADDPYTDSERERLGASLDSIYQEFKSRVTEGRSLDPDEVEERAKGRIWTGARAVELGLVDELGGLDRAVELAGELAAVPADRGVALRVFPRRRGIPLPKRKESSEPVGQAAALLFRLVDSLTGVSQSPMAEARLPSSWRM